MKTTTLAAEKQKITTWINSLEDKHILDQIAQLMNQSNKPPYDPVYEATLSDEEKVAYWKEIGISGDELFGSVIAHIKTLQWKK